MSTQTRKNQHSTTSLNRPTHLSTRFGPNFITSPAYLHHEVDVYHHRHLAGLCQCCKRWPVYSWLEVLRKCFGRCRWDTQKQSLDWPTKLIWCRISWYYSTDSPVVGQCFSFEFPRPLVGNLLAVQSWWLNYLSGRLRWWLFRPWSGQQWLLQRWRVQLAVKPQLGKGAALQEFHGIEEYCLTSWSAFKWILVQWLVDILLRINNSCFVLNQPWPTHRLFWEGESVSDVYLIRLYRAWRKLSGPINRVDAVSLSTW